MNERLKELRKALNLTQQAFADAIGVKRNTVATYEIGRNEPIDAVIKLICDRFHVNEIWLRTGEGEMFVKISKEDEIMDLVEKSLSEESGEFKRRLATAIMKLTPEQIRHCTEWIMENFLMDDQEAGDSDQHPGHADQDPEERELTIDEKVEDYRRQLEAEAASEKSGALQPGKEA